MGSVDARDVGAGGSSTAERDGDCAVEGGAENSCIVAINVGYTWMRKGGAVAESFVGALGLGSSQVRGEVGLVMMMTRDGIDWVCRWLYP